MIRLSRPFDPAYPDRAIKATIERAIPGWILRINGPLITTSYTYASHHDALEFARQLGFVCRIGDAHAE